MPLMLFISAICLTQNELRCLANARVRDLLHGFMQRPQIGLEARDRFGDLTRKLARERLIGVHCVPRRHHDLLHGHHLSCLVAKMILVTCKI